MTSSDGRGSLLGDGLGYFGQQFKDYVRENSMIVFIAVIGILIVAMYVINRSWSSLSWIFGK